MDNFKQRLIEEFGQTIVDHVSRNRGKYALGAGAAGLIGYGAYNGNLGSAAKNLVNSSAGTIGIASSNLPYEETPYQQIVDQGLDTTQAIYQAPIDPRIELEPEDSFKVGQIAGNVVNSIHKTGDHVRGMFESETYAPDIDEDDKEENEANVSAGPSNTAEVATAIAGSGAILAGVANADKIGAAATKVGKNIKDSAKNVGESVASSVKGKVQGATTSLAGTLLKVSSKLKDSKDINDKNIKERKAAYESRTKESEAKKARDKKEESNNISRLKAKLQGRK